MPVAPCGMKQEGDGEGCSGARDSHARGRAQGEDAAALTKSPAAEEEAETDADVIGRDDSAKGNGTPGDDAHGVAAPAHASHEGTCSQAKGDWSTTGMEQGDQVGQAEEREAAPNGLVEHEGDGQHQSEAMVSVRKNVRVLKALDDLQAIWREDSGALVRVRAMQQLHERWPPATGDARVDALLDVIRQDELVPEGASIHLSESRTEAASVSALTYRRLQIQPHDLDSSALLRLRAQLQVMKSLARHVPVSSELMHMSSGQGSTAAVQLQRNSARLLASPKPMHTDRTASHLASPGLVTKMSKFGELQRKLRAEMIGEMSALLGCANPEPIVDALDAQAYRKPGRVQLDVTSTHMSRQLQDSGQRHKQEQNERRKQRHLVYLSALMQHRDAFSEHFAAIDTSRKKLSREVEKFQRSRLRDEERRKRKEMQERLKALRENDEDQYMKLLENTKNERLLTLIRKTDEYLAQIGAQVALQKQVVEEIDARERELISDATMAGNRSEAFVAHFDENNRTASVPAPSPGEGKTALEQLAQMRKEQSDQLNHVGEAASDAVAGVRKRRDFYKHLTHTIKEEVTQPNLLVGGTLKPYQLDGLAWLVSLYNNGLNGILADEMGLGKTIQTLSLISYLVEKKNVRGPYLVIVPLATMSNWVRECELWVPSLHVVVYHGDPATRKQIVTHEIQPGRFNILLTTYEYVVRDKHVLGAKQLQWKYIIIDEGHRMKNSDCKLALTLGSKYKSRNRILLTGTPLQNNLSELWALLNFLLPTIFNSAESFEQWFSAPFQASQLGEATELNEEEQLLVINRLHQILSPFLLRRLKKDVESQLPDKVEHVIRCELSAWQKVLYRQVQKKVAVASGEGGGVRSFNNMVMQLKKICNHPYLFYEYDDLSLLRPDLLIRASGKFVLLCSILAKLRATNHRTLIFSQMTTTLDWLEVLLRQQGIAFLRMDGTTKAEDRQDMIEWFNAPDSPFFCFILSTRAGGLGLNLQTADTVIIYDSDWNPMMDLQAQDRVHRIGQTEEVRVFRLCCAGTIEEHILDQAQRKLRMDAQIIQAGKFNNKASDAERRDALKSLLKDHQNVDEEKLDVSTETEMNEWLARREDEYDLFCEMDAVRAEKDAVSGFGLLTDEGELPEWVLAPEREEARLEFERQEYGPPVAEPLGRGARRQSLPNIRYDHDLKNDDDLLMDVEGAGTSLSLQKRGRKRKAMALVADEEDGFDGESYTRREPGDAASSGTPMRASSRPSSASLAATEFYYDEGPDAHPQGSTDANARSDLEGHKM
ncbi:SWI/SNF chromatin-remodeling complex subunit snf22 [Porphyridium purpureum]|uniref:SWI/SNF chromatin-remodeling complex subunit snf22 n=1 Tax=Porphyridium purpureum TaxID=35688 RepID=A0A5J4Z6K5_PORPP|nr:SWI/SNF chromatin-remodeling complex subunit snf22 [Porphyridium purpureum]|eukprot:POR0861..scf295_1